MIIHIPVVSFDNMQQLLKHYNIKALHLQSKMGIEKIAEQDPIILVGDWEPTINYNINDSEVVVENLCSKNFYCKFPSFHRLSLWHKHIYNLDLDSKITEQYEYDIWFRNIVHHSNLKLRTEESFDG